MFCAGVVADEEAHVGTVALPELAVLSLIVTWLGQEIDCPPE